jgi:hypothetical protein
MGVGSSHQDRVSGYTKRKWVNFGFPAFEETTIEPRFIPNLVCTERILVFRLPGKLVRKREELHCDREIGLLHAITFHSITIH